jgi:L-fuconolactonase
VSDGKARPPIRAVDAHVHFWDPATLRYPWLDEAAMLRRSYLPNDYPAISAGHVESVIFVEANCSPEQASTEVAFISRLRSSFPWIGGVVAFVDMLDESARPRRLDELLMTEGVAGVRHNIQGHPRGFCLQPAFERGVRAAGKSGFAFDICATFDQLDEVGLLVERLPDTQFVLDHCGKPDIAHDGYDAWAAALERLSRCQNLWCKISGLLSEARADQQTAEALGPYIAHARDCFGAARLIYGSDWPVVTASGSESIWWDIVEKCTAPWPDDERHAFFVSNAGRAYHLSHVNNG